MGKVAAGVGCARSMGEEGSRKKVKEGGGEKKNGEKEKEKGREREEEIATAGFAAASTTGRARVPVGLDARNEEE